ncbi:MAG: hypothetical protein IPN69_21990 [Acidobacteria bacterium]|nr:hypothetical protein [Acidobacteriota bacterium]
MIKFLALFTLLGVFSSFCAGGASSYGAKTKFAKDAVLDFPDFKLTYLGNRKVPSEHWPNGFNYHDFGIRSRSGERTVSWSSGTGDIGPVEFEADGAKFQLELRFSEGLGKLAENELVITKK